MPLKIRLARHGAKKKPFYRIIVADSKSARNGRFIEKVGTYDPMLEKGDQNRITLDNERILHWIKNGATPSERVEKFLVDANLIVLSKKRAAVIEASKQRVAAKAEAEAAAKAAAEGAAA
jgi:small subunit ribosomal protein S16